MLIISLVLLLLSNSVGLRRDKPILYSRVTITILLIVSLINYDNLYFIFLNKGIGIFGNLFYIRSTTKMFHLIILLITSVILLLTSFYPRKIWVKDYSPIDSLFFSRLFYYQRILINKQERFKLVEYALIIMFVITGGILIVSTYNLFCMFLSIKLQSYGLYLFWNLHNNPKFFFRGISNYYLVGIMSSCLILLNISLLYANYGTTNLDNLYIITSIYNVSKCFLTNLPYEYNYNYYYYTYVSLLLIFVGFLVRIFLAPYYFWSPDVYDAIPTIVTTFVSIIVKISIFLFIWELIVHSIELGFDRNFSWTNNLLFRIFIFLDIRFFGGVFCTISIDGLHITLMWVSSIVLLLLFHPRSILFWIYSFLIIDNPKVHRFSRVSLHSTSLPRSSSKYRELLQEKNEYKEELLKSHNALKTIKDAIELDKKLEDKSKNYTMKQIMTHYKEFFDDESGNTKEQGLEQLYNELHEDFNLKRKEYLKVKEKFEKTDFTSQWIFIYPYSYNVLKNISFLKPLLSSIISILSLLFTISIIFPSLDIFDFSYFFIVIKAYSKDIFKYEIIVTLIVLLWYLYTYLRKYLKYIKFLKFLYYHKYIKKLGFVLLITIIFLIPVFVFIPEEFLSIANILALIF